VTSAVERQHTARDVAAVEQVVDCQPQLVEAALAPHQGQDQRIQTLLQPAVDDLSEDEPGADTFVDDNGEAFYLVRVRTAERDLARDGQALSIIPGMTAEVDILVGEKTVLSYLLKPVLRARESALREP